MGSAAADQSAVPPIASLYQRSVLDALIEVVRALSHDFVQRPQRYRAVTEGAADLLEGFRIRMGNAPEWLSASQRIELYESVFGDEFRTVSADLRSAACVFVERSTEANQDLLKERVWEAAVTLRGYLKSIEGPAVASMDRETGAEFRSAVEIFRDKEVAGSFGLPPAPGGSWPFDGAREADGVSLDGGLLIEEMQRTLGLFTIRPALTQHLLTLLQRVAYYGGATIAGVLGDAAGWNKQDWANNLIGDAYGWEKAMQASLAYIDEKKQRLQPRVVSRYALDDQRLKTMPTEEDAKRSGPQRLQVIGGGLENTCTWGFTLLCDNRTGPTCTSGWTFVCDTEPTCTYGWTILCDKRVL
jgi:hypothetical protein